MNKHEFLEKYVTDRHGTDSMKWDGLKDNNAVWVPPYGSGASLYVRPYMFSSSPVIGVKPAEEYQFRILCTPVGPVIKKFYDILTGIQLGTVEAPEGWIRQIL